jgi:PTH1 family peptidyl-tRNA hydrolase
VAPVVKYLVGLGNPGERYRLTRHNLGFRVVDELARRLQRPLDREVCGALVGGNDELTLVKPLTYMNRSGYSVRCLFERSPASPDEALIIYDDVALALGRLRLRPGGEPGGHRGMESIVENLRTTAVPRQRLGIGAPLEPPDQSEFVLLPFEEEESEAVERMVCRAADAAQAWLAEGVETAMNRYNGPS